MENHRVVTGGQDRPRRSRAARCFEHGVGAVDIGVQDSLPVGLLRDAAKMNDRIDALRGLPHRIEIADIGGNGLNSLARLLARYRDNIEQPEPCGRVMRGRSIVPILPAAPVMSMRLLKCRFRCSYCAWSRWVRDG